jgi:CHAT domain-containing protein/predicted negative regulator of RcsB-dependent stress response
VSSDSGVAKAILSASGTPLNDALMLEIASLESEAHRTLYFAAHPELIRNEVVLALRDAVLRRLRADPQQSLRLAEACLLIAEKIGNKHTRAHALRTKANALFGIGEHAAALEYHRPAAELYRELGDRDELARTLSASIHSHLLQGHYDAALAAAEEARKIFEASGNHWRIGRLEINVGNIYHRQDRFHEALQCYQRAYQELQAHADADGIAAALSNIATCQITLNDFQSALETYQHARAFCEKSGMPVLVAQADYNISWLYYLRGDYGRAIQMLRSTREACRNNDDKYHFALCHMDLSEIYLDLNLSHEACETADEGARLFAGLGMGYEHAKCLSNLAVGRGQQGQTFQALELFAKAREIFVREQNAVWPHLIDLYEALLLMNEGRLFEARRLCASASRFFDSSLLTGKAILSHLLLSRIGLNSGDRESAAHECSLALQKITHFAGPKLAYDAHLLMGELLLASGNTASARQSFIAAQQQLEGLRGSLQNQELKIAFMSNRLAVYEHLIRICLSHPQKGSAFEEAFAYVERSKSRALMESMFTTAPAMQSDPAHSPLVQHIRELREELNWYYHRVEQEQLGNQKVSPGAVAKLQEEIKERENTFIRVLRELPADEVEGATFKAPAPLGIDEIREFMAEDTTILEYFQVGDQLFAAVLTETKIDIIAVTLESRIKQLVQLLQFQMSKFQLHPEYVKRFERQLLEATCAHLKELHDELVLPVRDKVQTENVVVVPCGVLHYLPFHALFDGSEYFGDRVCVSYSPSASIFALCQKRVANQEQMFLILAAPDERAPFLRDEAQALAQLLPNSKLFLDDQASVECLKHLGGKARFIHIATHAVFRHDNPLFSGLHLGGSFLSLYDLYDLKLPAELITLSGCGTGLTVVAAGDEHVGLVRGLLQAGAKSLFLSLWNVHDHSATELMKLFYSALQQGMSKSRALQSAQRNLREQYAHPYYWAPFKIVGSPD